MILDASALHVIDHKQKQEDTVTYSFSYGLVFNLLLMHRYIKSTMTEDSLKRLPLYWFNALRRALEKMVEVYPGIQFIDVKSVNYGIRVHHTSTTENLNSLNKIKLELANEIDELILERIRQFHKEK